jgi:mycothiol synthase
VPEDAPAVLQVLVARDLTEVEAPDYTLGELRDQWGASAFDIAADAVVAELTDGRIAAYGAVLRTAAIGTVAPEFQGRGIGAAVLHWVQERERLVGRTHHRQWIAAGNLRAQALLQSAGYAVERSYQRMIRPLHRLPAVAPLPAGVRLRPLDVDRDGPALHAVDDASFGALPDYQPEPLQAFVDEHLAVHDVDVELSCVAEHGAAIAGFLVANRRRDAPVGYIDILAVHPDMQARGLGAALLSTALNRFAAAGLREAQLGVASDNPRALRLYERFGMTPRVRFDVHVRPVAPSAAPAGDTA